MATSLDVETVTSKDFEQVRTFSSEECKSFLLEHGGDNLTHSSNVHDPTIRLVIASATLVENAMVIIALLHSWTNLRQNIYIFALSIAFSDCLLGLVHIINSIVVGVSTGDETDIQNTAIDKMGLSSWFYLIRATTLLTGQVASTGNAACLVIAFKRYVDALAPSGASPRSPTGSSNGTTGTPSRLLSRKTCYGMTAGVWGISLILGIIPLFWNCGEYCACFVEAGLSHTMHANRCFENHDCSYMFPPLKSVTYILSLILFFVTLIILVVTCVQVINAAGGFIAFLPMRLHQYYARRRKSIISEDPTNMPRRLRGHSVQMTYMRDMMHFMILITIAFVICKLPAALLLLIESATKYKLDIPNEAASAIVLLSYVHSIINPIIFTFTLHGMKEALKKLIVPCCTTTISVSIGKQTYSSEENQNQPPKSTATTV